MFELLNLGLAGGLAGTAAPVIIHLLHRRRHKRLDWGAMRFLRELLARNRRRLWIEEWLLLALRVLAVAALAWAFMRPAWKQAGASGAPVLRRHGRTAAVLLLDDSLSTAQGRAETACERLKRLALAYLDTLEPGDEVSVLRLSQLHGPSGEPWFDLEAVKAMVAQVQPTSAASDVLALLEAGLAQLQRHVNPGAEVVLVFDGRQDGWEPEQTARWGELRARFLGRPEAIPGSRQRPHLLVLSPPAEPVDHNLALTALRPDRTLVAANRPVGLRAEVTHYGKVAPPRARVRLYADGRLVGEKSAALGVGEKQELTQAWTFDTPGSHTVQAALEGARDCLPLDDQRCLSVQVENAVPVLLVESGGGTNLQGSLGFVAAALDPENQNRGPFRLTRVTASQLSESVLQAHRVVVLGDVPAWSPELLDALERHVVGGAGLLVSLGPQTDPLLVNRFWARQGAGLLPTPLRNPQSPVADSAVGGVQGAHPVFSGFGPRPDLAWEGARVRRYYQLDLSQVKASEVDSLMSLAGGDPLLVERRRGAGLAALLATTLSARWNDLPVFPAYVPLVRGLVGHLGSFVMPPRNLLPGDRLTCLAHGTNLPATAEGPSGQTVALAPAVWEGRPAWLSEPLLEPGAYTVRHGDQTIRYAVAASPGESELAPLARGTMQRCLANVAWHAYQRGEQVRQALEASSRQSVELWRWCLGACLLLLFAESWMTRRQAHGSVVRGLDATPPPTPVREPLSPP